jgi:hypothetical protein
MQRSIRGSWGFPVDKLLIQCPRTVAGWIGAYGHWFTNGKQELQHESGREMMRSMARILTVSALVVIPVVAVAQSGSGRFATHDRTSTTQELQDGTKIQVVHYTQITFASDPAHPMDNKSGDCMGRFQTSADDVLLSGSGTCTAQDAAGNSASFWWKIEEISTARCAGACGSWTYYAGTGNFKDIKGTGTFSRDTMFHNGSSGTWKGEVTVK